MTSGMRSAPSMRCLEAATRCADHRQSSLLLRHPFGRLVVGGHILETAASDSVTDRMRQVMIVIGSGEIGSTVAVILQRAGYAVVVCDDVDPAWARRGMSFTNAWYVGNAELDGDAAVFCASVKSIPPVLKRERLIAATTWSWMGIAEALDPIAVVDLQDPPARWRRRTENAGTRRCADDRNRRRLRSRPRRRSRHRTGARRARRDDRRTRDCGGIGRHGGHRQRDRRAHRPRAEGGPLRDQSADRRPCH